MGSRRRGRIIAFQSLYRADVAGAGLEEVLDFSWMDGDKPPTATSESVLFARLLIQGTLENLPRIDEAIKGQLENWDFSRLSRVDLALLRISVYCLLFQPDIPATVTIDEAVEIARSFGADDSYRFVNGVLDAVRKANLAHGDGR
jgi:transcription antitermination protein NusB